MKRISIYLKPESEKDFQHFTKTYDITLNQYVRLCLKHQKKIIPILVKGLEDD